MRSLHAWPQLWTARSLASPPCVYKPNRPDAARRSSCEPFGLVVAVSLPMSPEYSSINVTIQRLAQDLAQVAATDGYISDTVHRLVIESVFMGEHLNPVSSVNNAWP